MAIISLYIKIKQCMHKNFCASDPEHLCDLEALYVIYMVTFEENKWRKDIISSGRKQMVKVYLR